MLCRSRPTGLATASQVPMVVPAAAYRESAPSPRNRRECPLLQVEPAAQVSRPPPAALLRACPPPASAALSRYRLIDPPIDPPCCV